ncbi:MAG: hypothetical protein MR981_03435, partial [Ruminococcus bromii]|nr:hypothetical protein [Ruminococcus bromii]
PTSLVAASSGSENLEISIYNTLPFVKVNPWYFSFFPQKSELHFGNLPAEVIILCRSSEMKNVLYGNVCD